MKKYLLSFILLLLVILPLISNATPPWNGSNVQYQGINQWYQPGVYNLYGTKPAMACGYSPALGQNACGMDSSAYGFFIGDIAILTQDLMLGPTSPTIYIGNADTSGATYITTDEDGNGHIGMAGMGGNVVIFDNPIVTPSFSGNIAWSSGMALDATKWSIGRNAGTPNQLQYNAPTGSLHEFSINGVQKGDVDINGFNGTLGGTTPAVANVTNLAGHGTILSNDASGLGWHVLAHANQACNTTCTSGGCAFGFDSGTTLPVACTDATADVCVCAQ